ncbi:hypothetical protein AB6A40_004969 [Gnathostoma spinigerum]|uniref:Calnexin n=1 Tax=Gnathostoma spinigerum TaxID=75299 RepID=A0ABD6EE21_9BILA
MEPPLTPPEKIDDPEAKKPADWDDREKIHDPDATKPADWDENAPPKIPDQSATMPSDWLEDEEPLIPSETAEKPKDWDDEMDGEWEAPKVDNPKCKTVSGCGKWTRPLIPNPDYKGKWKPPMIDNPNYKGKWSPKQIDNPEYFIPEPYKQLFPTGALGFELWTMSANIVIDNIYIGDDESAAAEFAKQTFTVKKMQEELFETASSPSQGIFSQLVSATEERPWLWVIYILSILVPVVVISVFCFGRKSRPIADYKKTDEPQNDDEEVPDLIGDDEEAGEEHPEAGDGKNNEVDGVRLRRSSQSPGRKVSPTRKASPSRGISPARKASPGRGVSSVQSDLPSRHSPADLITLEESDKKQEHVEKNKDGDNDEETQKKMEEQGSPRTRHIRQRKAD